MGNEMRCKQCGERLEENDTYCPKCFASVSKQDTKVETTLEGIEIETWKQFLGEKALDYIEIFKKHENKKFFLSFNPYAFFLNVTWMYYRKMYFAAIITSLIMFAIIIGWAFITTISSPLMLLIFPAALVFHFCVGAFSNCAYKNHIKKIILKHQNNAKKGGTYYAIAFIGTAATHLVLDFIIVPIVVEMLLKI